MALQLCDMKGRFLFEARPDLFPERRLTDVECALWGSIIMTNTRQNRERHGQFKHRC
jgi:hypothetical protein